MDVDEKSFGKLLSTQVSTMSAILTATGRVRPGDLRRQDEDGLGEFLAKLKRGEGPMTVADVVEEEAAADLFS